MTACGKHAKEYGRVVAQLRLLYTSLILFSIDEYDTSSEWGAEIIGQSHTMQHNASTFIVAGNMKLVIGYMFENSFLVLVHGALPSSFVNHVSISSIEVLNSDLSWFNMGNNTFILAYCLDYEMYGKCYSQVGQEITKKTVQVA